MKKHKRILKALISKLQPYAISKFSRGGREIIVDVNKIVKRLKKQNK